MADGQGSTYADGAEPVIPSQGRVATCPDCGCTPQHFKTECRHCGCPDGITRKRERDAEFVSAHGDASRPVQGFF